ncbi:MULTISPECIES: glucose PTS transporter subunit EIIB [Amycolatopsis]|uniref:glucose PTS transporter subunit EIIB n=1 Tax=Amycolatopsis TaxID=1813 RepID=UPI0009D93377|nr:MULTISPECIES: PTS glucose/sucrose transporter subunit IIB [Amycolatopsis methanolica group]
MLRYPGRCQPPLRVRVRQAEKEAAVADDRPEKILAALGGADNVVEIEGCITRLRCELEDGSLVDEAALKAAGAHGVMKMGSVVQVVVGPEADTIASDIQDLM